MRLDKTKNTKRNIIWGMLNQLVSLGLPFIIRTIIIHTLGKEYLGLNSLFVSIMQVLNITELGFSSAIIYSLYKPITENDSNLICAILKFYKTIYKIIGIVILSVGGLITPFLPRLINGAPPDDVNVYLLFGIYLLNTGISYLMTAYKECIILAHQRNDLSSKRNIIIRFIMYGTQIIALLLTHNYYIYILLLPITTVLNNIIIHYTVKKYFPQYIAKGELAQKYKNRIKKQVSGLMIIKVAAITRNSFDNIILSKYIGLVIVGIYGNYYYIMSSVQVILLILLNSIQAAIGNNVAVKNPDDNYCDCKNVSFIYGWISSWSVVCLLVFFQPFIKIWVGESSLLPFGMVVLMSLYFYVLTIGDVANVYIDATGIWQKYNIKSIVEAASNLFLNILLVKNMGIYGVVLATILTRFVFGILWGNRILFKNYFGVTKLKDFYMDHFGYFSIALISSMSIIGFNSVLGITVDSPNPIKVLECIIVPNMLFFLFYRKCSRFVFARTIVKRLLSRR